MADGNFFGGVADGITAAQTAARADEALGIEKAGLGIRERALTQSGEQFNRSHGLAERAQRVSEQNTKFNQGRLLQADTEQAIANTMKIAAETIKASLDAGRNPDQIRKAVTPLLVEAQGLGKRIGKSPETYAKTLDAMLTMPGSEEAAAAEGRAAAAKNKALTEGGVSLLKPDQKVAVENSLRDDYTKQSAPFVETQDAYRRIQSIQPDAKTGAGDIALLYSYMKMLDPRSTVREGEIATAQNAAGVTGTVANLYNSVLKGQMLTPDLRKSFRDQAKAQFETQQKQHKHRTKSYEDIAKRQGVDPRNVIIDLNSPEPDEAAASGGLPAPPPGFVISQ